MKSLDQIEARTPIPGGSSSFGINVPGSYYLTGNLTIGGGGANGISVMTNDVTIDLNGFSVTGSGVSSGAGIFLSGGVANVTIRHGTIRNWGNYGINGVGNSKVRAEDLQVLNNGSTGIRVDVNGAVVNCIAEANAGVGIQGVDNCVIKDSQSISNTGGAGILVGSSSVVTGCVASGNSSDGFNTASGCTLIGCTAATNTLGGFNVGGQVILKNCTAKSNVGIGIRTGRDATVTSCTASTNQSHGMMVDTNTNVLGCSASDNTSNGIVASTSSTIKDCTATVNGGVGISAGIWGTVTNCTADDNQTDGILVDSYSFVVGNNCVQNFSGGQTAGIHVTGSRNRIEGNNVAANGRGIAADTAGNVIIKNSAISNTGSGNYTGIVPGNDVGPIGTAASVTSPWANISD